MKMVEMLAGACTKQGVILTASILPRRLRTTTSTGSSEAVGIIRFVTHGPYASFEIPAFAGCMTPDPDVGWFL